MVFELAATAAMVWGAAGAAVIGFRKWARNESRRQEEAERRQEEAERRQEEAERRQEEAERRRDAEIAGLKSAVNGLMGMMDRLLRLHEATERRRGEDRKAADQRHEARQKA